MAALSALKLVGLLAVAASAGAVTVGVTQPEIFEDKKDGVNTQVANSVSLEQQVVLMSLGIQGIEERNVNKTFFGMNVPGSDRSSFLQYNFSAKIGLEGSAVKITQPSETQVVVEIPEYVFVGQDDIEFKMIVQDNGVLSWITPEIDVVEMTNNILNTETEAQYIENNIEVLRFQTENYFDGIIKAIDPKIQTEYRYAN